MNHMEGHMGHPLNSHLASGEELGHSRGRGVKAGGRSLTGDSKGGHGLQGGRAEGNQGDFEQKKAWAAEREGCR